MKMVLMKFSLNLFFLYKLILFVHCEDLTFNLKRENDHVKPSCVKENSRRYSAIGWIYPFSFIEESLPNATTKFIPSIKNDYNCKFSKNDKCNIKWAVKDWNIDETSAKTREFINDSRWEDLPTIFLKNTTTEFSNRFHIGNSKKIGFSVRALGSINLYLCTGWNPHNYPCYHFFINGPNIFSYKFLTFPNSSDQEQIYLKDNGRTVSNIVTKDEWRNFEINIEKNEIFFMDKSNINNEELLLTKFSDNDAPIQPLYLLIKSDEPSLWKIMENYFMYTETEQISRLGPQIQTNYKDLCISMYVATCEYCEMTFFYLNGTNKKELKYVGPTNENWIEIKLKENNIKLRKFNLFVETKLLKPSGLKDKVQGWWAYDDVRECNENEVEISYLTLNQTFAKDDESINEEISCQIIKHPRLRVEPLIYGEIEEKSIENLSVDFPTVKAIANDTAITLKWTEEDIFAYETCFIYYQGNELCLNDGQKSARLASGGFLTTRFNEVVLTQLIPYTLYNITISSVIHEKDRFIAISTLESDELKFEELPMKINIRPLDKAVNISWDEPNCNSRYGRLIYNILIRNDELKFQKLLEFQNNNSYIIDELKPYSKYNLTIFTARNGRNLAKGVHTFNTTYEFTTLPAVAPAVENLELYAIGPNKAYLRYDLPKNPEGEPVEVDVARCNILSRAKCRSAINRIARCPLWSDKMCVEIDYLMPDQNFTFKVAIRNSNTNKFGDSKEITAETVEKVPQKPENLTYQVVDCEESTDYCNLNINWNHPYYPNGTINAFHIILNSTYFNSTYSEEDQAMHEIYRVVNDSYLPKYTYQVKYVPYSREYNLFVQSVNSKYKSDFAKTVVKTADLGDHIDQSPKLLGKGDKAVVFKLPHLDRRLESYKITVGVQDYDKAASFNVDKIKNEKLADNICHAFGRIWVSQDLEVKQNESQIITIKGLDEQKTIKPNTKYCFIFIITNKYRGEEHDVVYYEHLTTPSSSSSELPKKTTDKSSSFSHLYMLFLLLLLVPIGFFIFWYIMKRKRSRKPQKNLENEYETLPFEEHDRNYANNRAYDKLMHK